MTLARPTWLLVLASACAHQPASPGSAELRAFYYHDDEGLQVISGGARVEQPVRVGERASLEVLVDRVHLQPVDAVTSASALSAGGTGLEKQRIEVTPGYALDVGTQDTPMKAQAQARVSSEPDYLSISGELAWSAELFQRNTFVTAFAGYGHDLIHPASVDPDEAGAWPAAQDRVVAALSVRQLVSRRVDLSSGVGLTWQSGALSSPYRRALVWSDETVFAPYALEPEHQPRERKRATAFVASAWYLGRGTALHLRLGGYGDSWRVKALAPEAAVVVEVHRRLLFTLSYRYYLQGRAWFFREKYMTGEPIRSGDRRLGALDEHLPGVELRLTLAGEPQRPGTIELSAAYQTSLLTYHGLALDAFVLAHLSSLAMGVSY
jgi:hypothetical protein